jgi:hypothetical protein
MIKKYCDDAKQEECLTPNHCSTPCHHDFSVLRKVKPYPEVPLDMYSAQEEFNHISRCLAWAAGAFLVIVLGNLMFAGYVLLGML